MDTEHIMELILRKPTEEVLTIDDLKNMIETGIPLKHYIGFEISGRIHIGAGIVCMSKVADLLEAGVKCSIQLADFHAWLNNKLGGEWENIVNATEYFRAGLEAGLTCFGVDPKKVEFITGTEIYHHNDEYWRTVLEIAKATTLSRILRSITIMGRKEKEITEFAQLLYPIMQVADIFARGINIAHAGTDQRKAHVIAREVALKLRTMPLVHDTKKYKPVAIHHHLILGLQQPPLWPIPEDMPKQEFWAQMKMSKSKSQTAVFIDDDSKTIKRKIRKAFCPEKIVDFNPIFDWVEHIIFRTETDDGLKKPFIIDRPEKFGGKLEIYQFKELVNIYRKGELHPLDLKNAVADYLIKFLEPARKYLAEKNLTFPNYENT